MNSELEAAKEAGRLARSLGKPLASNPYAKPATPAPAKRAAPGRGAQPAMKIQKFQPGGHSRGFFENWESGWREEDETMSGKRK